MALIDDLKKWGHPLKRCVNRKNTSLLKKICSFFSHDAQPALPYNG